MKIAQSNRGHSAGLGLGDGRTQGGRRPSAFTLIELLVVISIISLLIALLLPALRTAQTTSHLVQSLANQKQVTTAILLYAQDNRSSVPFSMTGGTPSNVSASVTSPTWAWLLMNRGYVSSINVYWSPARELRDMDLPSMPANPNSAQSYWLYVSYGANTEVMTHIGQANRGWLDVYGGGSGPAAPFPTAEFPNGVAPTKLDDVRTPAPERMMVLCEGWDPVNSRGNAGSHRASPAGFWDNPNFFTFRPYNYNGAVPYAFLDGHAVADNARSLGWNTGAFKASTGSVRNQGGPSSPYGGWWTAMAGVPAGRRTPWYYQYRKAVNQ
jgi:prepilin-type N-terminal cleavage/methylation domain-containing protein/prepilin-type processing-associated H-X9-DG protein